MSRKKNQRRSPKEWAIVAEEFTDSDLTLAEFCRKHRIRYNTARKYIKSKDKKKSRDGQFKNGTLALGAVAFKKRIAEIVGSEGKEYIRSLRQSMLVSDQVMLDSSIEFKSMLEKKKGFNSPGEAARVALLASQESRKIALEIQGIPKSDDKFGWPLTRGFWPHPYQRDFIFDLPSTLRQVGIPAFLFAFVGGVGSGKTRCGAEKAGDLAFRNRGCQGAIFAPTYRMLHDTTMKMFFDVLQEKGLSYHYKASDESILLFGDTKILCRSMDNPDHYRGIEIAWFWADEIAQMSERKAFDIAQGRIRDPHAIEPAALITSTPDGLNWLYDVLVEEGDENKVRLYHARTEQNISLGAEYYERLQSIYDERFAEQELNAKFINLFAGQAYWNFDRSLVKEAIEYQPTLPLKLAFDLNVDPMCWNIIQTHRVNGNIEDYIIDEIHIQSASTEAAAEEFLERYRSHKAGVQIYGDATSRNRTTATTRTDYQIIEETLKKLPAVEINIGSSNPRVTDRIAAHNARLKDMKGKRKLFIDKKCKNTIKDYEKVFFKPGTRALDKSDPELTHHTDAIGYYLFKEYPVRRIKIDRS